MSRDRKELFCGSLEECNAWIHTQGANARLMEAVEMQPPGPPAVVYWKAKAPGTKPQGEKRVSFETRGSVRTKGLTARPLVVEFDPHHDTITFRPKGTRQAVTVPILSVYQSARFTAARAIAAQRRAARKAAK